jgi:hypothetical protein
VEVLIASNEEAYRRKHYPTMEERVEQQKIWARMQLREAKIASERAALKKAMEARAVAARRHMEAVEEAMREGGPMPPPLEEEDNNEIDAMIPTEPPGPGGEPLATGDEENDEGAAFSADSGITAEMEEELLEIKERKLLATRKTQVYHREWSRWEKRKLALKVSLNWMGDKNRDLTEVLPWLLLGRREVSTNQTLLLQMGVTHILNMTNDCPCAFTQSFVYKRIPLRDSITADVFTHFPTIVEFIKRVEKCKGRVSAKGAAHTYMLRMKHIF